MSSSYGDNIKLTVFGESHGEAIGAVVDGIPAGTPVAGERIAAFMKRRAPGNSTFTTKRREADIVNIVSGVRDGKACGTPICMMIANSDARSSSYNSDVPRPSHADFPAHIKYKGFEDMRGGGHFSGRLTAPLCAAGAICLDMLKSRGIWVFAHISSIHGIHDIAFDPLSIGPAEMSALENRSDFPVLDTIVGERMKTEIGNAAFHLDSVGGVIECAVIGLPTGLGEPIFDGIENKISSAIFGIPAVKGIEFGNGFASTALYGSENNDAFSTDGEHITLKSNNAGGVSGGLATSAPLIFRIAIKPTPSIGVEQDSISFSEMKNTKLKIKGRHDPCIVVRAVPCVEAATALAVTDLLLGSECV